MTEDFHILPTPALRQAASSCPLLEGDLENWIRCCSRRFFPVAKRIAGGDDLAQDILQMSWIKVLQSARACRGGPRACPWVHAIVLNTARDVRRKEHHRGEVPFPTEQEDRPENPAQSPEALAQEIPSGATGVISVDFALPPARDLQGRVVDSLGSGVPIAAVRVRYHEPNKPVRRVSFDDTEEQRTDGVAGS